MTEFQIIVLLLSFNSLLLYIALHGVAKLCVKLETLNLNIKNKNDD